MIVIDTCLNHYYCTSLYTTENATTEIPRVINAAIQERRPVHIHLPIDVAVSDIEVEQPFKVENTSTRCISYVDMVADKLRSAKQPLIIAGHEINSFHLHDELEEFVNKTNIPVVQLSLGKGHLMKKPTLYGYL